MTTNTSYANGNILRGLNLINFTLPVSGNYETGYYDVSEFSGFVLQASTDTPNLNITVQESLDGSGSAATQNDKLVAVVASTNTLEDLGSLQVKSRFLRFSLSGAPSSTVNIQFLFQKPKGSRRF